MSDFNIHYVARLARIALSPEEERTLGTQLDGIIGYIAKLKEVDVSGVEPTAHAFPLVNVTARGSGRVGTSYSSPNLDWTRPARASRAFSASGPSQTMVNLEPGPAASMSRPMMDLPLMVSPSFSMSTSQGCWLASLTKATRLRIQPVFQQGRSPEIDFALSGLAPAISRITKRSVAASPENRLASSAG